MFMYINLVKNLLNLMKKQGKKPKVLINKRLLKFEKKTRITIDHLLIYIYKRVNQIILN